MSDDPYRDELYRLLSIGLRRLLAVGPPRPDTIKIIQPIKELFMPVHEFKYTFGLPAASAPDVEKFVVTVDVDGQPESVDVAATETTFVKSFAAGANVSITLVDVDSAGNASQPSTPNLHGHGYRPPANPRPSVHPNGRRGLHAGRAAHAMSMDSPLTIVRVPIDRLHADPANANTHDERNLRTIRDSLREFGQVEPLVVQKGTGRVIGGNGRLEVMRDEGVHEVDVVEFEGSEVQARALAIALNRTAKTSVFDDTILAEQLRALQSEDFPIAGAGFTDAEVDALLQSLGDEALGGNGEVAQDEPPPLDKAAELQEKWGTVVGQLWVVPSLTTPGRSHRILCGDCTKPEDVERLMDGAKVQGAFTSPPYAEQRKSQYGGTPADQYVAWWEAVQAGVRAILSPMMVRSSSTSRPIPRGANEAST
jgi:hypothetical protein